MSFRTPLVLGLALGLAGCAVDPAGIPGGDDGRDLGPGQDAAALDQGTRDLGNRDLGPPDGGPADLGPPDAGPPPFCSPTAGLVGCYPFEGASPFIDRSGAGNDLIATGVTVGAGAVGEGAYLTAGSSLYANDSPSLDPSGGFSAELWAYLDIIPVTGRMGLMDKNGQFGLFVHAGGRLTCSGGTGIAETTVSPATWLHIACTHDGSTIRLYVDGTERASVAAAAPGGGTATLNLGEDSPGGGDQLGGRLDEIRLWTGALSPAVIQASAARR